MINHTTLGRKKRKLFFRRMFRSIKKFFSRAKRFNPFRAIKRLFKRKNRSPPPPPPVKEPSKGEPGYIDKQF